MNNASLKIVRRKFFSYSALIGAFCILIASCTSAKKIEQKVSILDPYHTAENLEINDSTATFTNDYMYDDHYIINLKAAEKTPSLSIGIDSIPPSVEITEAVDIEVPIVSDEEDMVVENISEIISPVAYRIVDNYLNSENKEPGGHCLTVSKNRFDEAYKQVHGHVMYKDLPERMRSKFYSPKEVYNFIYVSASGTHRGWRSLPEDYRGKGNAGAIAYAGMGTLIDNSGIWGGELQPGALMQVWRFRDDYEKVVKGVDIKNLDPYGHSFIFISYVRNENNEITGLKIADQGFQSYRPLIPRDYEVWWAVNLSI